MDIPCMLPGFLHTSFGVKIGIQLTDERQIRSMESASGLVTLARC